jgi:hypothetical protein
MGNGCQMDSTIVMAQVWVAMEQAKVQIPNINMWGFRKYSFLSLKFDANSPRRYETKRLRDLKRLKTTKRIRSEVAKETNTEN